MHVPRRQASRDELICPTSHPGLEVRLRLGAEIRYAVVVGIGN
jgi:hypothetical protein